MSARVAAIPAGIIRYLPGAARNPFVLRRLPASFRWTVSAATALLGMAAIPLAFAAATYVLQLNEVRIEEATYGGSCRDYAVPAPFANTFAPGNATGLMRAACDGKASCGFTVSVAAIGDPANGCEKDFQVRYHCFGHLNGREVSLPAEANGKSVAIDCWAD